jgi:hypothetical protein
MTVFILDRKTGDYLSADGKWVPDRGAALSFPTSTAAFNYCLEQSLSNCDILLHSGSANKDVRLPFRPGQS